MAPEESDCQDSGPILQARDQPVVIAFDVEHDPARLENARLGIGRLYILRVSPLGSTCDGKPSFALRTGRFDSFMAGAPCEVILDDLHADDDHL